MFASLFALQILNAAIPYEAPKSSSIELTLRGKTSDITGIGQWERSKKSNELQRLHIVNSKRTIRLNVSNSKVNFECERTTLAQEEERLISISSLIRTVSSKKASLAIIVNLAKSLNIEKQRKVSKMLESVTKADSSDGFYINGLLGYRALVSIEVKPIVSSNLGESTQWVIFLNVYSLSEADWISEKDIDPDRWKQLDMESQKR